MPYLDSGGLETQIQYIKGYVQAELEDYATLMDLQDYLPLSGGTMTGNIDFNETNPLIKGNLTTTKLGLYAGANNFDGANIQLFGRSDSDYAGRFYLRASTKSSSSSGGNETTLAGTPDGKLTWAGHNILTDATVGTTVSDNISSSVSLTASTARNIVSKAITPGTWIITGHAKFTGVTAQKLYCIQIATTSGQFGSSNNSAIVSHSSSTSTVSVQTVRVIKVSANTTVYVVGYATAACTVEAATIVGVRIV